MPTCQFNITYLCYLKIDNQHFFSAERITRFERATTKFQLCVIISEIIILLNYFIAIKFRFKYTSFST